MGHAGTTAIAGLIATVIGLLALIANEGVFFSGDIERIQLNVSAFDCEESSEDHVLSLGIGKAGFFDLGADLILEVDLTPYAHRRCKTFQILPRREAVIDLSSIAYVRTDHRLIAANPAKPNDLQKQECDCLRLDNAAAEPGLLRLVLPDALQRVAPDAYSVRISAGGIGETPFLGAYGQAGYAAKDGWDHDVTFQLAQLGKIVSMTSILFATLLGIGVGALFEATLRAATSKRLATFGAALRTRRRSRAKPDQGSGAK